MFCRGQPTGQTSEDNIGSEGRGSQDHVDGSAGRDKYPLPPASPSAAAADAGAGSPSRDRAGDEPGDKLRQLDGQQLADGGRGRSSSRGKNGPHIPSDKNDERGLREGSRGDGRSYGRERERERDRSRGKDRDGPGGSGRSRGFDGRDRDPRDPRYGRPWEMGRDRERERERERERDGMYRGSRDGGYREGSSRRERDERDRYRSSSGSRRHREEEERGRDGKRRRSDSRDEHEVSRASGGMGTCTLRAYWLLEGTQIRLGAMGCFQCSYQGAFLQGVHSRRSPPWL